MFGVIDCLEVVERDCREDLEVVGLGRGGAMEGRLLVLSRDLTLESDVRFVVVGVPVRGVVAVELAPEPRALVGDFVGDCAIWVNPVLFC